MLKRLTAAAMMLTTAACASGPAPTPAPAPSPAAPSAPAAPGVTTEFNVAATSVWVAEERLLPQQPILALVGPGGSVEKPAGLSFVCNPSNGVITARLGKQPAARVGQNARYTLKLGQSNEAVEGAFQAGSDGADFVFTLNSAKLRTLTQFNSVAFDTDQGEPQWAFVADPATPAKARFIGSLKNIRSEADSYLVFCNPK